MYVDSNSNTALDNLINAEFTSIFSKTLVLAKLVIYGQVSLSSIKYEDFVIKNFITNYENQTQGYYVAKDCIAIFYSLNSISLNKFLYHIASVMETQKNLTFVLFTVDKVNNITGNYRLSSNGVIFKKYVITHQKIYHEEFIYKTFKDALKLKAINNDFYVEDKIYVRLHCSDLGSNLAKTIEKYFNIGNKYINYNARNFRVIEDKNDCYVHFVMDRHSLIRDIKSISKHSACKNIDAKILFNSDVSGELQFKCSDGVCEKPKTIHYGITGTKHIKYSFMTSMDREH